MSSDDDYRPEEVALEEEEEVQIIDSDSDYCVEEDSDYSAEKKNAKVSKKRAAPAQHTLTATKRPRPNARDGVDDVDVLKRCAGQRRCRGAGTLLLRVSGGGKLIVLRIFRRLKQPFGK